MRTYETFTKGMESKDVNIGLICEFVTKRNGKGKKVSKEINILQETKCCFKFLATANTMMLSIVFDVPNIDKHTCRD